MKQPLRACLALAAAIGLCAAAAFTWGYFLGFTSITPYWLNMRRSPCTRTTRSPRFLKLSQVARSAST